MLTAFDTSTRASAHRARSGVGQPGLQPPNTHPKIS